MFFWLGGKTCNLKAYGALMFHECIPKGLLSVPRHDQGLKRAVGFLRTGQNDRCPQQTLVLKRSIKPCLPRAVNGKQGFTKPTRKLPRSMLEALCMMHVPCMEKCLKRTRRCEGASLPDLLRSRSKIVFPQTVWIHLGVLTVVEKQLMLGSLKRAGVCG